MFAITGITGNVGGDLARSLLAAKLPVRAVVRDTAKGAAWAERGCDLARADIDDAPALATAFMGVEGVFVLVPPNFDPAPGFPEARSRAATLRSALERARPEKVVYLSTIGAQAAESNLLTQHSIIEQTLGELSMPITFLRPGWFMENAGWDLTPARETGVISSFLQPLDKPVPMVATADVGRVAAELIQETWKGHRVVELEGPTRVTPNQIAATFAEIFSHPVQAQAVPRQTWEQLFKSQGMKFPGPRIQMLDGFNQAWIEFEQDETRRRKGRTGLKEVLTGLAGGNSTEA